MGLKKRLFTMAVIACAAAAVAVVGLSGKTISQEQEESIFTRGKETIYFWYRMRRLPIIWEALPWPMGKPMM